MKFVKNMYGYNMSVTFYKYVLHNTQLWLKNFTQQTSKMYCTENIYNLYSAVSKPGRTGVDFWDSVNKAYVGIQNKQKSDG